MRIAISIAGVSYEDGSKYRYRNYEDSVNEFNNNVIDYLKSQGNEVFTFIYTYQTDKCNDIINTYNEFTEAKFIDENNQFIPLGQTIQAVNIIAGLNEVLNWEFDYVIRARFDQKFLNNPFTTYDWDFDKVNFEDVIKRKTPELKMEIYNSSTKKRIKLCPGKKSKFGNTQTTEIKYLKKFS